MLAELSIRHFIKKWRSMDISTTLSNGRNIRPQLSQDFWENHDASINNLKSPKSRHELMKFIPWVIICYQVLWNFSFRPIFRHLICCDKHFSNCWLNCMFYLFKILAIFVIVLMWKPFIFISFVNFNNKNCFIIIRFNRFISLIKYRSRILLFCNRPRLSLVFYLSYFIDKTSRLLCLWACWSRLRVRLTRLRLCVHHVVGNHSRLNSFFITF